MPSGELKRVLGRGVAIGSLQGVLIVVVLYIALNLALVFSVSLDSLAGEELALAAAIKQLFGSGASLVVIGSSVLLTVVLVLIGDFEILLTMAATLFLVAYVALVLGVFKLRKTEPETARPFSAWGFPYTGIICAIGWVSIATYVAVTSRESTLYGAILIVIALPVYLLLRRVRHLDGKLAESKT